MVAMLHCVYASMCCECIVTNCNQSELSLCLARYNLKIGRQYFPQIPVIRSEMKFVSKHWVLIKVQWFKFKDILRRQTEKQANTNDKFL